MDEPQKEGSFTISDKRRFVANESGAVKAEDFASSQEPKAAASTDAEAQAPQSGEESRERSRGSAPLPAVDFSTFILSLSSSVLLHLGLIENPHTRRTDRDLPLAKQTIDLIDMLKTKTKGNLSVEEENLIENLLAELKLKYVNEIKKE